MNTDDGGGLFACRPILCVDSVARSIEYYVDLLGFRLGWSWSDVDKRFLRPGDERTPTFALVTRGQVQLMLSEKCQGAPGMWLHLDVHTAERLDALYEEWTRKGARIVEPPSCRPWGMYEMRVQDPDGHVKSVGAGQGNLRTKTLERMTRSAVMSLFQVERLCRAPRPRSTQR